MATNHRTCQRDTVSDARNSAFPRCGEALLKLPGLFLSQAEQRTTVQGQVYFLHTQTGVSTWHDPRIPR